VAGVHGVTRGDGGSPWHWHEADIHFTFVMAGTMVLEAEGREPYALEVGDAFVIPPGLKVRYTGPSEDIELLEVSLPGRFATHLEG
jgi:quercetin dioxygenase-like cupin family protein